MELDRTDLAWITRRTDREQHPVTLLTVSGWNAVRGVWDTAYNWLVLPFLWLAGLIPTGKKTHLQLILCKLQANMVL